ncbi:MAG: tyrosine--tRNA ligase [Verrucomicrobiales bacterium]
MATPDEQLALLRRGAAKIVSEQELLVRLKEGRPLRVKLGVDPTAPDIHLGHTVAMEKLRQFQELGHIAVLIIGDFTAMIGDPTGRSAARPPLTHDEIMRNAETYTNQAFKILDRNRTETVYNGQWLRSMAFADIIKLCSQVTLQQMLQREDFRSRINEAVEVRLHEILYPVMQGWDSVETRADVELGGSDQLFNILVGRDLQRAAGLPPQIVLLVPLLEGTDGTAKMSKSAGNYIGVDEPASEIFGKTMSISDELMARWYVTLVGDELGEKSNPMEAKMNLAEQLAERFAGSEAAAKARTDWEARFCRKNLESAELPYFSPPPDASPIAIISAAYSTLGQKKSNSDIRRLLEQGSIQLDGEKLNDTQKSPCFRPGAVLRLDKKHAVRVK